MGKVIKMPCKLPTRLFDLCGIEYQVDCIKLKQLTPKQSKCIRYYREGKKVPRKLKKRYIHHSKFDSLSAYYNMKFDRKKSLNMNRRLKCAYDSIDKMVVGMKAIKRINNEMNIRLYKK